MHDKMWEWLDEFPGQIEHAAKLGEDWDLDGLERPESIAFLGIGGSAIGATLVSDLYRQQLNCPVVVSRGDQPPSWLGKGHLAVAISYSGETKETLTSYRRALEKGASGISISSGGSLAALAQERNLPHLLIAGGMAPRAALGYTSLPLIHVLQKLNVIPSADLALDATRRLLESLRVEWGDRAGAGAGVARRLIAHLPILVGAGFTCSIARRFQAQLAENAKAVSILFEIPEALHNLVETVDIKLADTLNPIAVYLEDPDGPEEWRALLKNVRAVFQGAGIEGVVVSAQGDDDLTKLFSLVHKTDWISYHLAKLKAVDPLTIPIITALKEKTSHQ